MADHDVAVTTQDATEEHSQTAAPDNQVGLPYIGQWNRLTSNTNWEKGEIICSWRAELESAGAASAEFSDEAWSRRVGNVSPQHVGRLRRVAVRFGAVWQDYEGVYWSHFQSALEWDDAEGGYHWRDDVPHPGE